MDNNALGAQQPESPNPNLVGGSTSEYLAPSKEFGEIINKYNQLLERVVEQQRQVDKTLDRVKATQEQINETRGYVLLGFIGLVIILGTVAIGFTIAYLQLSITNYNALVDKLNAAVQTPKVIIITPTPSIIPTPS